MRTALIITSLLCTSFSTFSQQTIKTNLIIFTIDHAYVEGCETGKGDCKPIVLKRHSIQDSIKVIFPIGGTITDVFLNAEKEFIQWPKGSPKDQPKPLRHDHRRSGEGNPAFDLTGLPDGKYGAYMLACGLGGSFQIVIVTENE